MHPNVSSSPAKSRDPGARSAARVATSGAHRASFAYRSNHNNGFFPAIRGFDLATGIGTPKMNTLITEFF
jgi:hypothetical protein